LTKVGEVEEYFANVCAGADLRLESPYGCNVFLNWFDTTPRDVMRRELKAEVELALRKRRNEEV
jgi:hypothetical protein